MNPSNETSLQSTVESTSRALADRAHRGIDNTAQALHDTAEKAAVSATDLAKSADRSACALLDKEKQARSTLLTYSREHPLRAIAIGLGVGYLMAKITKRRVH